MRPWFITATLALASVLSACASAPSRISVEWTTASEVNTAGFNLYRGDQSDGPFAKLNSNLIPASPDPITGGKYKYEDANVRPGQTYYYRLEDVELNGTTTSHGPIKITANGNSDQILLLIGAGLSALAVVFAVLALGRRRTRPDARPVG